MIENGFFDYGLFSGSTVFPRQRMTFSQPDVRIARHSVQGRENPMSSIDDSMATIDSVPVNMFNGGPGNALRHQTGPATEPF